MCVSRTTITAPQSIAPAKVASKSLHGNASGTTARLSRFLSLCCCRVRCIWHNRRYTCASVSRPKHQRRVFTNKRGNNSSISRGMSSRSRRGPRGGPGARQGTDKPSPSAGHQRVSVRGTPREVSRRVRDGEVQPGATTRATQTGTAVYTANSSKQCTLQRKHTSTAV